MNKPLLYTLLLILIFSIDCFGQHTVTPEVQQTVIKNGIGLGSVIAAVTSWERNKSVFFAALHGLFSWVYVIYFVITRQIDESK